MEFTKEEIETAIKIHSLYTKDFIESGVSKGFNDFADSLLKPETKFINVRIEYDEKNGKVEYLLSALKVLNFNSVTELPEVFTREDMIEFANYHHHVDETVETNINDWLSERKSK